MLRLNEVKLPLDHSEEELHAAVIERLDIELKDLLNCVVFRRAIDARKRSSIQLTYTLDVEVNDESTVLNGNEKLKQSGKVAVSPDTSYHFVTHAPQEIKQRPVVIGTGWLLPKHDRRKERDRFQNRIRTNHSVIPKA